MAEPQLASNHLKKLQAFELKYLGQSHLYIARLLNINLPTLSTYFSREWKADYEKFAQGQDESRKEMATLTLRRSVEKAVSTLVSLLDSDNEQIKFKASIEIINRGIGSTIALSSRDPVEALLEEYRLMDSGRIIIDDGCIDGEET